MTLYQQNQALRSRSTVFTLVASGYLKTKEAARILGCRRETIWYRRKQISKYGNNALVTRKRGPKPFKRAWNRTDPKLEEVVVKLRDLYETGADDIGYQLSEQGITLHRNTIYRILVRMKRIVPGNEGKRTFKRYTLGFPGAEVQLDPTYIEEANRPFWIFAGVDDHTRWGFANRCPRRTAKAAINFLRHIVRTAPFPIQAVRTDQGGEFGATFSRTCTSLGILHIKNRIKTPQHNGKVERFHRSLQWEWLWRYGVNIEPELHQYLLDRYLAFYNYSRHHQGLGMQGRMPFEQLTKFIKHHQATEHPEVRRTVVQYSP